MRKRIITLIIKTNVRRFRMLASGIIASLLLTAASSLDGLTTANTSACSVAVINLSEDNVPDTVVLSDSILMFEESIGFFECEELDWLTYEYAAENVMSQGPVIFPLVETFAFQMESLELNDFEPISVEDNNKEENGELTTEECEADNSLEAGETDENTRNLEDNNTTETQKEAQAEQGTESTQSDDSEKDRNGWTYHGVCRITSYCYECNTPKNSYICAKSGSRCEEWKTCAANDLPLGTIIYIDGLGEFLVNDTGGDSMDNGLWIDIFVYPEECEYWQLRDVWIVSTP